MHCLYSYVLIFLPHKPKFSDECCTLFKLGPESKLVAAGSHVPGLQTCSWVLKRRRSLVLHHSWRFKMSPLYCQSHKLQEPLPLRIQHLLWSMCRTLWV